jgi:hypothetical protein
MFRAEGPHGFRRAIRWRVVSRALGLVLVTAAVLKLVTPTTEAEAMERRPIVAAISEFELAIGLWLLLGVGGVRTWWVAVATFVALASVAVGRGVSGAGSCGCFGSVHADPRVVAGFDGLAIVALVACYRSAHTAPPRQLSRARWLGIAAMAVPVAGVGAWTTWRGLGGQDGGDGLPVGNGVTILEPQNWTGKRFPLEPYIDIGGRVNSGRIIVLLYRQDCDHCQRAIPRYRTLAEQGKGQPNALRVALVEMPPYAARSPDSVMSTSTVLIGRLSDSREWFASTPVAVLLVEGRVVRAAEGERAESPDALLDGNVTRREGT